MYAKRPSIASYGWQSGLSGEAEEGEEDDEAEEVDIDESHVDKARNNQTTLQGKKAKQTTSATTTTTKTTKQPPPPTPQPVFLDDHYTDLYNHYMEAKMPEESEFESEEEWDDLPERRVEQQEEEDEEEGERRGRKRRRGARDDMTMDALNRLETSTPRQRCGSGCGHCDGGGNNRAYDTRTRPECFLCAWTNKFHDRYKAKHVSKLHSIMDNYAGCDNVELAMQLHLYFKKKVYKPELGMTMWTSRVALEHIEGLHSLSALIFLGESIKKWKKILFGLENQIYRQDKSYYRGAVTDALNAQKMLNHLYTMKLEQMNFNFGKSTEDTKKIGRNFNFLEEFKQSRSQYTRKKKKQKTQNISNLIRRDNFDDLL
jgi:hypothetical protein